MPIHLKVKTDQKQNTQTKKKLSSISAEGKNPRQLLFSMLEYITFSTIFLSHELAKFITKKKF